MKDLSKNSDITIEPADKGITGEGKLNIYVTYQIAEVRHVTYLVFFVMPLSSMSCINSKEWPFPCVEFRGQGPYCMHTQHILRGTRIIGRRSHQRKIFFFFFQIRLSFIIRNMNRILGIDHSRIVDLLQVLDISCTVSVPVRGNQFLSLKVAASRDPDCALDRGF